MFGWAERLSLVVKREVPLCLHFRRNLAALSVPRTADANVHIMGYLWDWIDARDEEAMAEEIIGQVRAAVEAGELPLSADEFTGEKFVAAAASSSARRRTKACTRPPTRRLS